jgi:hypothetical protein
MCLAHRRSRETGEDESDFPVSIIRAVCIARRPRSCVIAWRKSGGVIAISSRLAGFCQVVTASSPTSGSLLKGALVSSVI